MIEKWCIENGHIVNPCKIELILVTYKSKLSKIEFSVIFGSTLKLSNKTDYLGVMLDRQLN